MTDTPRIDEHGNLTHCMSCNSDDLSEAVGSNGCRECYECEARHYRNGGDWLHFPNDSGRRAMDAQAATVQDRSDGAA